MPDLEHFKYCEQFFVMDIVVELGQCKSQRVEGDQLNFAISQRYGGKDSSKGIVQGIRFNNKQGA